MYEYSMSEADSRLFELGGGFIAVDERFVNLDDILNARRPGAIVRCMADPRECITIFRGDAPVGVVAGWISEEEAA